MVTTSTLPLGSPGYQHIKLRLIIGCVSPAANSSSIYRTISGRKKVNNISRLKQNEGGMEQSE